MKHLFIFLSMLISGYCFSQSRLLDIHSDELSGILGFDIQKSNTGYFVSGTGNVSNDYFCWLTKTDHEFNPVWRIKFKLSGKYFQVNSKTVTTSILSNDQIILLAKSMNDDSTYTELASFDQNGNFLWGKKWSHTNAYFIPVDLNEIIQLPNNDFIISHSVNSGNAQMKLNANGTVLFSKFTHLVISNDTITGVFNLPCSDGGMLQILRSQERKTVVIKLNAQYQISWTKEIQANNRSIWIVNAHENSDGSFWLFGSITANQAVSIIDQVYSVIKMNGNGTIEGIQLYNTVANMGIAQIYQTAENNFTFSSTEGEIGSIDLNNGIIQKQYLDIFQANHGLQNLHKLTNEYALTGLGANWQESKIQLFSNLEDHPCLNLYENESQLFQDTIPLQDIQSNPISAAVETYSFGSSINPTIESADITFVQECSLGLKENELEPELEIYPNPSSSNSLVTVKLNVLSGSNKRILRLFDLLGNQVLNSEVNETKESLVIDIHSLEAGTYFVNISSLVGDSNFTGKLIIR